MELSLNGVLFDPATQPYPDITGNESRPRFKWNPYVSELGIYFEKKVKGNIFNAISKSHKLPDVNTLDDELLSLREALIESIKSNIKKEYGRIHPFMFCLTDNLIYYIQKPEELCKLKKNIPARASIEIAHKGCLIYDKDAFIYEDSRLQDISDFLKNEVVVYYNNEQFLLKTVDVLCCIMKEDIRWRRILIKILQDIEPTVLESAKINRSLILISLCGLCEIVKDFQLTDAEIANARYDVWNT